MKNLWTPLPPPEDLPICSYPGCSERAPFGYGVSLRSEGRHFCGAHRPGAPAVERLAAQVAPAIGDLFSAAKRRAGS